MKPTSYLRLTPVIVALFMSMGSSAMAQDSKQTQLLEQRFKAANKTGDGKLTREEANAGMPKVARNFDKIDKDHKGYLTLEDIKAAMKVQAK